MYKDDKKYHMDLKENARGRFLKVSETFTRGYSRFQVFWNDLFLTDPAAAFLFLAAPAPAPDPGINWKYSCLTWWQLLSSIKLNLLRI